MLTRTQRLLEVIALVITILTTVSLISMKYANIQKDVEVLRCDLDQEILARQSDSAQIGVKLSEIELGMQDVRTDIKWLIMFQKGEIDE